MTPEGDVGNWTWNGHDSECSSLIRAPAGDPVDLQPRHPRVLRDARAGLGVRTTLITPSAVGAPFAHGAWVHRAGSYALASDETHILPDSAAQRAGFAEGDVIVAVDGRRIEQPSDCVAVADILARGQRVRVELLHAGTVRVITVTPTVFRWPPESMGRSWSTMPAIDGNGMIEYLATDPLFLYRSGFVDQGRFSYRQWLSALERFRTTNGRYRLDRNGYYSIGTFRYPFNGNEYEPVNSGRAEQTQAATEIDCTSF